MKYIDQLNWFSNYCLQQDIPSREILLYHCLLSVWNRSGRKDLFPAKLIALQSLSGLSASAVCQARSGLCQRELISYNATTKEYFIKGFANVDDTSVQQNDNRGETENKPCGNGCENDTEERSDNKQFVNDSGNEREIPYKVYIEKEKEKELEKDIYTPTPSNTDLFAQFWEAYPRKTAKQAALKAFRALKPAPKLLDAILTALEKQKQSDGWQRDGGQYIPYPATYLRQRRWEDELPDEDPAPPEPPPPVVVTPDMDVDKRIFGPNDNPLEAIP